MINREHKVIQLAADDPAEAELHEQDEITRRQAHTQDRYAVEDGDDIPEEVKSAAADADAEDESIWKIELPTALAQREIKIYLLAAVVLIFSVALSISMRAPEYLIFLVFAALLIYLGVSSRLDYRDGDIVELSVLCYSAQKTGALSSNINVSFCTTDDIPTYYKFVTSDKRNTFSPGCPYLVYYSKKNPRQLLAYLQL